jgi:hypothetical protein
MPLIRSLKVLHDDPSESISKETTEAIIFRFSNLISLAPAVQLGVIGYDFPFFPHLLSMKSMRLRLIRINLATAISIPGR